MASELPPLRVEIWHDESADLWYYRCPEIEHIHVLGVAMSREVAHDAARRDVGRWAGAEGRELQLVDVDA